MRTARLDTLEALSVPTGDGVCLLCHGPLGSRAGTAVRCRRCEALDPAGLPDLLVPVAIALTGTRLAGALWRYKAGPAGSRAEAAAALAEVLARWLDRHCACLGEGLSPGFAVAATPSRTGGHHLRGLASTAGLHVTVAPLGFVAGSAGRRVLSTTSGAAAAVAGRDVLLLDDTWTSGRTVSRGVALLRSLGAERVGVLVVARHVSVGDPGALGYLAAYARPWRSDTCVTCAG